MKLVLASQSEARKRLLCSLLGHSRFQIRPAHLDEDKIQEEILKRVRGSRRSSAISPSAARKIVRALAERKAKAVFTGLSPRAKLRTRVIGSDQLLLCRGRIVGKPGTLKKAVSFLKSVRGESALLLTAVAVCDLNKTRSAVQAVKLSFSRLSDREIESITRHDRPIHCAGSFKVEGRGIGLFDRIDSDDPTGIQGLPVLRLKALLLGPGR